MKRIILIAAAGMLFSVLTVHGAWAFGVKDVVKMHQAGIADSLIVQKIEYSGKSFDLNASDITRLKDAGVSDVVISAMLRTEAEKRSYGCYGCYDGWPRTSAYLGFGLGYYGYYHGPYDYAPYYAPYYGPRFGFRSFEHRGFATRGFRDRDLARPAYRGRGFGEHDGGWSRRGGFGGRDGGGEHGGFSRR